ncbi:hypothetical protein [Spiroplasma endosymbiont of Agriotes lineatus]|uniref:hypothetical protein n=1 Tax=Spiroplasma endosymbiont of Agriotes lineatus TaxID=3077930 RepID=UPI0030D26694
MKKFLGILGTIIMAGSGTLTLVANSPTSTSIKTEEKILKLTKRWEEVQWLHIQNQWNNSNQEYQRVALEFQRNQNHTAFNQAQQRFLRVKQSYNNNNSAIEWQQGLTQWEN